jgi:Ca2+-binding EF-hand superfamily protein
MFRWALVLPLVFLAGLPADEDKGGSKNDKQSEQKKDDKKAKGRPLVNVDAFMKEYDRDNDGFLSKEEMPDWLHYNFDRLDTNKDGKISKDELTKGMAYLQQRRRPSDVVIVLIEMSDCDECCGEEIQRAYEFLSKLDKNKDGKLDAGELKAGREMLVKERVDGLIRRMDANKDGKISRQEARGMVKEHFDQLDRNKDGFVDRDELMAGASARPADDKDKEKAKGKDEKREKK